MSLGIRWESEWIGTRRERRVEWTSRGTGDRTEEGGSIGLG